MNWPINEFHNSKLKFSLHNIHVYSTSITLKPFFLSIYPCQTCEINENGDAIVPPKDETAPETPEKVEKDGAEVEQEIEALEAEIKEDTLQLEQQDETDPKLETNAQQLKKVILNIFFLPKKLRKRDRIEAVSCNRNI